MQPWDLPPNLTDSRIVISYRRADSASSADLLATSLRQYFGDQVFLDVGQIDPGRDWQADIARAIDTASAVIVMIGPQWMGPADDPRILQANDVVRFEVGRALSHGKPVFPVLVGNARIPTAAELPADLATLSALEAVGLSEGRWRFDVGRLIDGLARVGIVLSLPGAFPEIPPAGRLERRSTWLTLSPRHVVFGQLGSVLHAHGMQSVERHDGITELKGGSRGKARMMGTFFAKKTILPSTGLVRVTDGPKSRVEVLLREDLGAGLLDGIENIFGTWFETCLADFRRATQDA